MTTLVDVMFYFVRSVLVERSLFQISMVRMDWVPSQDGLRQILQLLKVIYVFNI